MNFDEMDIERLRHVARGLWRETLEIKQILGKALGYPLFKNDKKNFLNTTEEHGVCVGDHVAITLAMEASDTIKKLSMDSEEIKKEMLALQKRKIYTSEDSKLLSRYQMFNELNNNKIDFHIFDNWLEEMLSTAYNAGKNQKKI